MGGHEGGRPADRAGRVHPDHGLADGAERRGQVELRHHVALEHVRGLADDHRVDIGPIEIGVGQRHLGRLAYQAGNGDVVALGFVMGLAHSDHGAPLGHQDRLQDTDQVLLQARPRGGMGHSPPGAAGSDGAGRFTDADEAGRHERVGGERASGRVDRRRVVEAEGLAEDQLLVGVGRVQLGHVDRPVADTGHFGGLDGRGGDGEVAGAEGMGLHAVVDAGDPRLRVPAPGIGRLAGGEHDGRGAIGDGRQRVATKRGDDVVVRQQLLDRSVVGHLGVGVATARPCGCGRPPWRSRPRWPCPRRSGPGPAGRPGSPGRARGGPDSTDRAGERGSR